MNLRTRLFDRITFHKPSEPDVLTADDTDTMQQLVARGWKSFEEKQGTDRQRLPGSDRHENELRIHGETFRDFDTLKGLTLFDIQQLQEDELLFHAIDTREVGKTRHFKMWYEPDCCAECSIEDITGDFADLIGTPILMAEQVTSNDAPEPRVGEEHYRNDSETWTFYKLATIKGSVTIRWYGASNGYYSEEASFAEFRRDDV